MNKLKKVAYKLFELRYAFAKVLCCVLAVGFVFTISTKPVLAERPGSDDDDRENYSLYDISLALTAYYGEATAPSDNDNGVSGINFPNNGDIIGNAGAFVGYTKTGWFTSFETNSSSSNSYRSFENVVLNDGMNDDYLVGNDVNGRTTTAKLRDYCQYGYLLGSLGLDTCSSAQTLPFGNWIMGGIVLLLFVLATGVPTLFGAIITLLKLMNPFQLFQASEAIKVDGENIITDTGASWGDGFIQSISSLYDTLSDLSWGVIVPIFFAMLVVWLLLFKNVDKKKKVKQYIIRIAFIAIGIPILGACYSGMLDYLDKAVAMNNSAAAKVVASTFCDFETWAVNSRLGVPEGVTLAVSTAKSSTNGTGSRRPTMLTMMKTRETCFKINRATGAVSLAEDATAPFAVSSNAEGSLSGWNTDCGSNVMTEDTTSDNEVNSDIIDMLTRYSSDARYYGSAYASEVSNQLSNAASSDKTTSDAIKTMFENGVDMDTYEDKGSSGGDGDAGNGGLGVDIWVDENYGNGYNIYANGTLARNINKESKECTFYDESFKNNTSITTANKHGLSTISMYNYLNTDFRTEGLEFYSSAESSSLYVRNSHSSVSLVGTGLQSILYWLDCCLLLANFAIIGLWYCVGLLISSIKRTIKTISGIPFAMLGSLRAISTVVCGAIAMILEIIATIFVYDLVLNLLVSIPSGIISTVSNLFSALFGLS